ncbi:MAG: hypothetical protein DIKNOCCD_01217 [bacterium]|nr:hypothetical protein [bacterium]MBV6481494.1 hypothetical protein [bacterium]MCE7908518.1 hypothetical protein [Candidatus Omnitrophica bacterium COP1]
MFTILHAIHLFAVVVAIGGSVVLRFIVYPFLDSDENTQAVRNEIFARWRKVVWIMIILITLTGLGNAHQSAMRVGKDFLYWMIFSAKIILALGLFGISLMLTLPGETYDRFRRERNKWMHAIVALGGVIILISAYLRLNFPGISQ